jgi:circadian clock protein KaiB
MAQMIDLRLYLSGQTPLSDAKIAELRAILDGEGLDYRLTIKDVFECPEDSFEDAVYATPTLVKRFPLPITRIIGELADRERVLVGLKISHDESHSV